MSFNFYFEATLHLIESQYDQNAKPLFYHMDNHKRLPHGVLIIAWSIYPRSRYQPESFSLKADKGRGLILRVINKTPCYNLFITYSISHFDAFDVKKVSKTQEWRKFCVTSPHLFTSDVIKWSTLRAGHYNLSPFKIHDLRFSSRQADNQLGGKSLSHLQTLDYQAKSFLNMW